MTPEQVIQLTSAMKDLGVEVFELEGLKVRFIQPLSLSPVSEFTKAPLKEDIEKRLSEMNEKLMFGSSM